MILFVNDKKIINQTIDEELILNNIIEFEKRNNSKIFLRFILTKSKLTQK